MNITATITTMAHYGEMINGRKADNVEAIEAAAKEADALTEAGMNRNLACSKMAIKHSVDTLRVLDAWKNL